MRLSVPICLPGTGVLLLNSVQWQQIFLTRTGSYIPRTCVVSNTRTCYYSPVASLTLSQNTCVLWQDQMPRAPSKESTILCPFLNCFHAPGLPDLIHSIGLHSRSLPYLIHSNRFLYPTTPLQRASRQVGALVNWYQKKADSALYSSINKNHGMWFMYLEMYRKQREALIREHRCIQGCSSISVANICSTNKVVNNGILVTILEIKVQTRPMHNIK